MRLFITPFTIAIMLTMISCTGKMDENTKFETLTTDYIERMLELNPEYATALGDHRFDNRMNDYSLQGMQDQMDYQTAYLDSLAAVDLDLLNRENRIDYDILVDHIKSRIFSLDTIRSFEWNPRVYNVGDAIYGLMARDFAPIKDRLECVRERLRAVPDILDQARINLKTPPRIFTETAISQNRGTISLIKNDLNQFIAQAPGFEAKIKPVRDSAVAALEAYGQWLETDLLPRSNGDFRLGYDKYRAKLRYSLDSDLPPEVVLKSAETDLAATRGAMYETALPLYREYFPDRPTPTTHADSLKVIKKVLDHLAENRPNADNIVDVIKTSLKECDDFVKTSGLVTHPDEPIKIIVMPEYQRGVAIGYCDSPGPLEKNGETFYAISPPPADWDRTQVESYFKEYNDYMLRDLSMHEGTPGHYLQLAHANKLQAPTMVRTLFGSGTFIEGWATYAEQVMVEQGFGGPEVKMQQLKMRLRMILNAIIDQKIHTQGMSEDEAMALLMNEGLQEYGEAAGKWRRACLTSTQLSTYYVGNLEINDIRNAYRAKYGEDADLKTFHDRLLSFGSPPPKYVKELMEL